MATLDLILEEDHESAALSMSPMPPMPTRHRSSDDVGGIPKPPLPMRRHSVGQTSHKYLHEEDPAFFDELKHLWDERPESPLADREPSTASLATETLGALFSSTTAPTKHPLSYDVHAPHQLDLFQPFRSTKQAKTSETSGRSTKQAKISETSVPRAFAIGPEQWMTMLKERKVAPRKDEGASSSDGTDRPPVGWTPTLTTVNAVLKLRRRHYGKAGRAAAAPDATAADAGRVEAMDVSTDDLQMLGDFDVQSFFEECWIAQAASLQTNILQGAYDAPIPFMAGHYPMSATAHAPFDAKGAYAMGGYHAQPPPMAPMGAPTAPYGMAPPTFVTEPYAAAGQYGWSAAPMAPMPMPMPPMHYDASTWGGNAWSQSMAPPPMAPAVPVAVSVPVALSAPTAPPMHAPMAAAAPPPASVPHGALLAMAQEQEGSRILQQQLWAMPPAELAAAVAELAPHLASLATHTFGNYLVSAMAFLPAAQPAIHQALAGQLASLMQHPQASRVCQAAFERLPRAAAAALVSELEGRVCEVACTTHGSWSVVAAHKHTGSPFILSELAREIGRLATLQNGSRVVQRVLLAAATRGEDVRRPMAALAELGVPTLAKLAQDKFGNYVVQIALRHAPPAQQATLRDALMPSLHALALEKCGSNVAEVLVELASMAQLAEIRRSLGPAGVEALRTHAYGSYVMTALDARRA